MRFIQNRLRTYSDELRERLNSLNAERREVFGSIPTELISTQRITTAHNCTARDIVPVGGPIHLWLQRPHGLEGRYQNRRCFLGL